MKKLMVLDGNSLVKPCFFTEVSQKSHHPLRPAYQRHSSAF